MKKIEELTICEELGKGSIGTVYLAKDDLGNSYAVKVLNISDDYTAKRFKNEHFALNSLNHEYITRVHRLGKTSEDQLYLVMEYCDGVNLRQLMDDEKCNLSLKSKLRIIRNLADALGTAHKAKIVHRDIKPSNILINVEKNQLKITDFGIALLPESTLTTNINLVGTPSYMSPESFKSSKVTPASDVYSLGVVAYELFLGQPLFDMKNIREIHELGFKALTEEPMPPHKVNRKFPINVSKILEKMLMKNPHLRYANGKEAAYALDKVLKNGFSRTRFYERRRWQTR